MDTEKQKRIKEMISNLRELLFQMRKELLEVEKLFENNQDIKDV